MEHPFPITSKNRAPLLIGLAGLVAITVPTRPSALLTFALIALSGNLSRWRQHH
ncbi:MAG: hypothetical protein QF702_04650 [Prochlorococcaceae cyanobacterium ETNP2_MAG_10]|jgi:hypothetical protein|nr:hypothetical protein [Prochlorococcaceae cyanobacterium ETNP2_MAG_10]